MYVKPEYRRGILPSMLEEILETRIMVKKAMKAAKNNKVINRCLMLIVYPFMNLQRIQSLNVRFYYPSHE